MNLFTLPNILAIIKVSGDPLINIAGAYFPAWLACMIVGIFGTWIVFLVLTRCELSEILHPPEIMIPAVFAVITLWTWMIHFAAR